MAGEVVEARRSFGESVSGDMADGRERGTPEMMTQQILHLLDRSEEKNINDLVQERSKFIVETQRENEAAHLRYEQEGHRLVAAMRSESAVRQLEAERLTAAMEATKEKRVDFVQQESNMKRDVEMKLQKYTMEKLAEARGVLQEEMQVTQSSREYTNQIRDEVCRLYSSLQELRQIRASRSEELVIGVKEKLNEVRQAVVAERRIRQRSEKTLLELFGDMGEKMQSSLEAAKVDRRAACGRIFDTLESIVPALDSACQHAIRMRSDKQELFEKQQGTAKEMLEVATTQLTRRRTVQDSGKGLLFKSTNK